MSYFLVVASAIVSHFIAYAIAEYGIGLGELLTVILHEVQL